MKKKIIFRSLFAHVENNFGLDDGGKERGHSLLYPLKLLRQKIERKGWEILLPIKENMSRADVIVCLDINARLYEEFKSANPKARKILICGESVIYAPLSHNTYVLTDKIWDAVLTWNRAYQVDNLLHYDIPIAGIQTINHGNNTNNIQMIEKGVTVSSYKGDSKGCTTKRDELFFKLAGMGQIDLYGPGWKKGSGICGTIFDKIKKIEKYQFSVISENALYSGYVTEKLGDSILAGIPAIYYGDIENAQRRFPGTFVALESLNYTAFKNAKTKLLGSYETYKQNVLTVRKESIHWCDSYINSFLKILNK